MYVDFLIYIYVYKIERERENKKMERKKERDGERERETEQGGARIQISGLIQSGCRLLVGTEHDEPKQILEGLNN